MKTCVIIVAPLLEKIFRPEPHEAAEISEKWRNKNFWPEIPGADAAAVTALMHVLELLFSVYLSGEGSQVVKMERIVLFFSVSQKKSFVCIFPWFLKLMVFQLSLITFLIFFSKFKCIVKVCEENHDDLDRVMVFFANLNYMDGV